VLLHCTLQNAVASSVSNGSGLSLRIRVGVQTEPLQIGGLGWQYTRTVTLGTVQKKSPNPSELGGLSAGRPAGPSIDSNKTLVFGVC